MACVPLGGRFNSDLLADVDRVQRAGFNLSRLVGELGAELAIFRYVQTLERSRAQRRANTDR